MSADPHVKRTVQRREEFGQHRGDGDATIVWPEAADLVELDIGDRLSLFTLGKDLREQVEGQLIDRSGSTPLQLKRRLPSTQRGIGDLVIRALQVVGVNVDDWLGPVKHQAAELIAAEVARRVDQRKVEGRSQPGLWHYGEHGPYGTPGFQPGEGKRSLLLLHGFFSHSLGSFGGLWSAGGRSTLDSLRSHYRESIYAFDHPTLGESPIRNALNVVQALGEHQELHLLGYSRGCLVGELLSRAQAKDGFSERELQRLQQNAPGDEAELRRLIGLMQDKNLTVTRFVRVAGPLRGTWLASNRLDRWLSIFYNVVRHAAPDGARQLADHVFDVIAAVIKKRLQREHFPGIEAMRPDGALMALLNDAPATLDQRLTVIAGDCVGHGILNRLKILLTDGFFGEPHDLVVPTASMFGGAPRSDGLRYFFHTTTRVDHFQYFRQPESLQRIRIGLIGDKPEYERLQLLEKTSVRPVLTANRAIRADAPLDIVLPGIMGSGLAYRDNERLWVDLGDIAFGNFARLQLSAQEQQQTYPKPGGAAIYPSGALDFWPVNFYGRLLEALSKRGDLVIPQGYDWRKPIAIAADALAARLQELWPEDSPRPLRLIGHSMGGLVIRQLFARHPALRRRFVASRHNRVLMLGTPNAGSLAVARTLLGQNDIIDKLDCLAPQNKVELLSVAATFPGFFELLPQGGRDWSKAAVWQHLFDQHGTDPRLRPTLDTTALALGARGREELATALEALPRSHCVYVAGFVDQSEPDATIIGLDADGAYVRGPGDGTVSYASGLIDGVETYYVDAAHGDLAAHRKAFPAYFELLDRGETTRLARRWQDLRRTRSGVPLNLLRADELPYRPTRAEIIRALLGASAQDDELQPSRALPIALRAVHGGLRFARHPLIVGHYHGDTMRGSEAELDRLYGGQLRTALELGVYPGAVEGFEIFKRAQVPADRRSPYAIIVGLGRPGELSVGELRRTVRRGILGWFGTAMADLPPEQRRGAFSLVLLGTSISGMTVAECVRAMLQGANDAQQVLLERPLPDDPAQTAPSISELEIIELYEDKALELAGELPRLLDSSELRHSFSAPAVPLERRADALRRLRDSARSVAAVRRLDIRAYSGGRLRYALPGIQAAVPLLRRNIDIEEIRAYAREIDRRLNTDPTIGRVLFQQLLPLELKHFALEQYDLLLTVDESAASIPWELADAGGTQPLSVQAGMVRQLRSRRYAARERVSRDTALVIGEPRVPGLPPLPGARREAEIVAEALIQSGFNVEYLDQPDALAVRDALGRKPYRIIHFAGHGVVDYRPGNAAQNVLPRTGMVIGSLSAGGGDAGAATANGSPPGHRGDVCPCPRAEPGDRPAPPPSRHLLLLTPEDVRECVDVVPELVFINCCHLGRQTGIAQDAPRMASNLANVFMSIGCRAVVAAGWAVDDTAAQGFAEAFYRSLVGSGHTYIDAVRAARAETHRRYGDRSPTWGAYQCYGDPHYTALRSGHGDDGVHFVTQREFQCWLETVAVQAMGAETDEIQRLSAALVKQLDANVRWLGNESLCRAAVAALSSVGAYERALALIEQRQQRRHPMSGGLWRSQALLTLRLGDLARADEAMPRFRQFAEFEGSAASWYAYSTYCRRWFLLKQGADEKIGVLGELLRAAMAGFEGLRDMLGKRFSLDKLSVEHAQKTFAALIVADCLQVMQPAPATSRSSEEMARIYRSMEKICRDALAKRNSASAFWDDVDSADLRLLLLVSPHLQKFTTLGAYLEEARSIATEYRIAMQISATAEQRESIAAHSRFWYALAGFCNSLPEYPSPHRLHWTWLRQAMSEAALPGIVAGEQPTEAAEPPAVAEPAAPPPAAPASEPGRDTQVGGSTAGAKPARRTRAKNGGGTGTRGGKGRKPGPRKPD